MRVLLMLTLMVALAACSPADPVTPPPGAQPDAPDFAAPGAAEATFSVVLVDGGAKKIDAIKAVRQVTRLGLADAKALVDGAPSVVATGLSKAAAEEAAAALEEAGIDVEIRPDR